MDTVCGGLEDVFYEAHQRLHHFGREKGDGEKGKGGKHNANTPGFGRGGYLDQGQDTTSPVQTWALEQGMPAATGWTWKTWSICCWNDSRFLTFATGNKLEWTVSRHERQGT